MKYYGYKLKSSLLKDIEHELDVPINEIQKIAEDEFSKLLGEEISFLADNITLGILNKGEEDNIIEIAKENLKQKIHIWNLKRIAGKYNFSVYGYLFSYKNHVYVQTDLLNPVFEKGFSLMEDVGIDEIEMQDDSNHKRKLWTEILKENHNPISINMSPALPEKVKPIFPSVKERSQVLARHKISNKILSEISGGEQIPPYLLMKYMDETLIKLPEYESEIRQEAMKLQQILLDFNKKKNLDSLKPLSQQRKEGDSTITAEKNEEK